MGLTAEERSRLLDAIAGALPVEEPEAEAAADDAEAAAADANVAAAVAIDAAEQATDAAAAVDVAATIDRPEPAELDADSERFVEERTAIIEAEAEADARRLEAAADAEATVIEAQAEAAATVAEAAAGAEVEADETGEAGAGEAQDPSLSDEETVDQPPRRARGFAGFYFGPNPFKRKAQ